MPFFKRELYANDGRVVLKMSCPVLNFGTALRGHPNAKYPILRRHTLRKFDAKFVARALSGYLRLFVGDDISELYVQ